jgi:phosphoribosylamine--glycine ligase
MRDIIEPTVRAMAAEGTPYTGFLYAGLMIAPDGTPRTLEFNCRMGDPETQPILMRLRSDLVPVLLAATEGRLDQVTLQWDERVALGVVVAAEGYPLNPRKGDVIEALPADGDDAMVFHAGTALDATGRLVASGGRVLCCTALGTDVAAARARAYALVDGVRLAGMQYRRDIGHRALARG